MICYAYVSNTQLPRNAVESLPSQKFLVSQNIPSNHLFFFTLFGLNEHFYFLNHFCSAKIERNIDLATCLKNAVFQQKSQIRNFRRSFYARRIFYAVPKFFLKSKHTFEHFYFLNHVHLSKIEKNIDVSDLFPQNCQKGGGLTR